MANKIISGSTVKVIENASHLLAVSQTEVVNEEILAFLKR